MSALGVLSIVVGCDDPAAQVVTAPPPPVKVTTPAQRSVQEYDEFTGRVAAMESVDIRSRVSGYILKAGFKDGDEVAAGQVLFEIDPRPFVAQLDIAKAKLQQAEAEQQYADRELARIEPLAKTGGASQLELSKAIDMVARAKGSIAAANADIEARKLDVDYATVKSPIAGRVSKSTFSVGNLIAGDTLLTTVVSTHPIHVTVDMDERRLLAYRSMARTRGVANPTRFRDINLPMFVALANETDFPHKGICEFVDNRVDPLTGTIRIRAEFDNTDRSLIAGQFVRARIPRGDPTQQILVPDRAIAFDQDRKYVLVVNDKNVVEYRAVETGGLFGEERAVTSGLKADEQIVLDGLQRARPGQTVAPTVVQATTRPATSPN